MEKQERRFCEKVINASGSWLDRRPIFCSWLDDVTVSERDVFQIQVLQVCQPVPTFNMEIVKRNSEHNEEIEAACVSDSKRTNADSPDFVHGDMTVITRNFHGFCSENGLR